MDNLASVRSDHFRQNCLAWATLVHFLPADLLREFCFVTTDLLSSGKFSLGDLFEERLLTSVNGLDCWEIRPRDLSEPLALYLQHRIRTFAWGSDSAVNFEEPPVADAAITPLQFENAVQLGIIGFYSQGRLEQPSFPEHQPSIGMLRDSIFSLSNFLSSQEDAAFLKISDSIALAVEMPLAAVMIKHLGDLCVGSGEWDAARRFYEYAEKLLANDGCATWRTFSDTLKTVTAQSIAATLCSIAGPKSAAEYLLPKVEAASIEAAALFVANSSFDAYVYSLQASESHFAPDHRTHLLLPPLLLSSHDLAPALVASVEQNFQDSRRYFWAVLRRQVAIGAGIDTQTTRALYARALFQELDKVGARHHNPHTFKAATTLLIESQRVTFVEKMSWSEKLIHSYVDSALVDAAIAHAQKVADATEGRINTLLIMLKGWAEVMVIERADIAHAIINFLAKTAEEKPSSLLSWQNVGGNSIKYIRELAEKRPEFRAGTTAAVTTAIVAKLQEGEWWTAVDEAFRTASEYVDVLSNEDVFSLVESTLSLLSRIDPAKNVWVVVRPALDFLTSRSVKNRLEGCRELADRVVSTILDFGLNQETEHARLLFFLSDFDLTRLGDKPYAPRLAEVLTEVRNKAKATNASNAIDNIKALLVCPTVSGTDGVNDALNALEAIFRSALDGRPAPSFPVSYEVLLLLSEQASQTAAALSISLEVFCAQIGPLLTVVTDIWGKAKDNPMVFAQFSLLPQTKPNETVVHNWAFASISFAKIFGRENEILQALSTAAEHVQLADPIEKARAARLAAGDLNEINLADIQEENRETFYAALGQRLTRVRAMADPVAFLQVLLGQALRHGPCGLDAAVFLLAFDLEIEAKNNLHYANYERRLEGTRELRLALSPLLHVLG